MLPREKHERVEGEEEHESDEDEGEEQAGHDA